MTRSAFAKPARWARALWADTDGIILPYVTVMLVVLVGTSVLAVDGSRYMSLQSQLQKGADALAIAGAGELNNLTDAITRATAAVDALVSNAQYPNTSLFGTTLGPGTAVSVTRTQVRFMSTLPSFDYQPITSVLCTVTAGSNDCTAANAVAAQFIEVRVLPTAIPTILPVFQTSTTAGASAVAGRSGVSCGLTPIMICNPFEQSGDTYAQATGRLEAADADPAFKRRAVKLAESASPGVAGTWGPGDFGYLVPETGTIPSDNCFPGGQEIGRALALDNPLICVRQNGVDLLTGNTTDALRGLNTRFGKYAGGQLANRSECKGLFPPDRNSRTGWVPASGGGPGSNWCDGNPDGTATGQAIDWPPGPRTTSLPVDACLLGANSCSPIANVGADSWDCATYWNAAHALPSTPTPPAGCTGAATISRYDVYKYEIDNNYLGDQSVLMSDGSRETGTPQCAGTTPTADRRIIFVAVVNCLSSPVPVQSNATNVPVAAFAKFFLTHAIPTAGGVKPYAEFRELVKRNDTARCIICDQIQLYR